MKIRCLYKIVCLENGMIYIGSTVNFKERKAQHIKQLNNHSHHNYKLQKDWHEHGAQRFTFVITKRFASESRIEMYAREDSLIKSFGKSSLYNIKLDALPMGEKNYLSKMERRKAKKLRRKKRTLKFKNLLLDRTNY